MRLRSLWVLLVPILGVILLVALWVMSPLTGGIVTVILLAGIVVGYFSRKRSITRR